MHDDVIDQQLEDAKDLLKQAQVWINKGIEKEAYKDCAIPKAPSLLSKYINDFLGE